MLYPFLRSCMFMLPPEEAHNFSMKSLEKIHATALGKKILANRFNFTHPSLEKEVFGLKFKNPVGLAAGFDKNAIYLESLQALGFSHVEIGTVTPKGQPGNDRPRSFRLPQDKALINRMGFNNHGAEIIRTRLELWRNNSKKTGLIVGGNIGKNKVTENEDAWKDYVFCFLQLFDVVDYFVVNVSSPNTPGLRALQEKDSLAKIFTELKNVNLQKSQPKPLLLKIAPDLTNEQLDDIVQLTGDLQLDGLVATNTTISRENLVTPKAAIDKIGAGGLSGKPVKARSTAVLKYLRNSLSNTVPLIASGGIFTADDAREKLNAGAALIQVYTGFIYQGPGIVKDICKGLV